MVRISALVAVLTAAIGCGGEREGNPDAAIELTPGSDVALTILSASADRGHVVVEARLTDQAGEPRARDGFETHWTLAVFALDSDTGASTFNSFITAPATGPFGATDQPTDETDGAYADQGLGRFRYTFAVPLPKGFDAKTTLRIGAWTQRTLDMGTEEVADAVFDFVPAGGTPAAADVVATAACNQCHSPLAAHGGSRRDVRLCMTCHTTQLVDPNTEDPANPGAPNPLELRSLVHRIHDGVDLPTIKAALTAGIVGARYDVVGFEGRDSVFAETVAGPKGSTSPVAQGVEFPRDIRECTVCHQQAPLSDHWKTVASRAACGSCHDDTWFGDPAAVPPLHKAHPGAPMLEDRTCSQCHVPMAGEYDLSVAGAHTVPRASSAVKGLVFQILRVSGSAGSDPEVIFTVVNGDGSAIGSLDDLDTLNITISGPSSAYSEANEVQQDPRKTVQAVGDGSYRFRFADRTASDPWFPNGPTIPANATGTFAVGIEGRRALTLGNGEVFDEGGNNPVVYFSVDASPVAAPSPVVAIERCNDCHAELRAHGNLRTNPEYCVFCHTFDGTDWTQRPKSPDGNVDVAATIDGIEERSIRFLRLIHFIHTGEDIDHSRPFVIYGFKGSVNEFDEVRFPGNLARCETCHLPGTFTIDAIPASAPPTLANQTATIMHHATPAHVPGEPTLPVIQSVCLSCHDTDATNAHAAQETSAGGQESCAVCHGEGRQFAVTTVHAQ